MVTVAVLLRVMWEGEYAGEVSDMDDEEEDENRGEN
jgi:hypothetical protein